MYANLAEIRTTTKKIRIKAILASLLDYPDEGIAQDPKTFGPANTNPWKMIKQVNGTKNPPLPYLIIFTPTVDPHPTWRGVEDRLLVTPKKQGKPGTNLDEL